MKKFLVSICAAFAMMAMVSCGNSNPAIAAAEALIAEPTVENMTAFGEAVDGLTDAQKAEYTIWLTENAEKIADAQAKAGE